jgi:hypothetical protein
LSEQIEETKQAATQSGGSGLKAAAAAAAAAGAAAIIARKALSGDHSSNGHRSQNGGKRSSNQGGMFGSIASGGWDAARDALGPAAEDAAAAVGKFVAENAPEIVRDRIVPRFIESFNEARST